MMTRKALVAAVAAMLAISGTANAAPPVHESFHDEFSFIDNDFCGTGLSIEIDGVVDGRALIQAKGKQGLIYFAEHLLVATTFTNPESGATITSVERTIRKDLHVVDNGDGTLTVVVLATGNFTMYGADGTAIGRNPGQFRFELLIDHGGTPIDPSDDVFLEFHVLKESTGRSDDFCAVALEALAPA